MADRSADITSVLSRPLRDYTISRGPETVDADGNTINPSGFNVTRSYINITGNISHIVAFRITPDVVRESSLVTLAPGSTISNDSLVFRIKYAFAQITLDDWMPKGSWARLGISFWTNGPPTVKPY